MSNKNILKKRNPDGTDGYVGCQTDSSIHAIIFLDTLSDMPADASDASASHDRSVMAWLKPTEEKDRYALYIAGEGGVSANPDSSFAFCDYSNLTSIDFTGFCTDKMTNASWMFENDGSLTSLDIASWNVANVTNMSGMFYACKSLKNLNIQEWNAANISYVDHIFYDCDSLSEENIYNTIKNWVVLSPGFDYSEIKWRIDDYFIAGFEIDTTDIFPPEKKGKNEYFDFEAEDEEIEIEPDLDNEHTVNEKPEEPVINVPDDDRDETEDPAYIWGLAEEFDPHQSERSYYPGPNPDDIPEEYDDYHTYVSDEELEERDNAYRKRLALEDASNKIYYKANIKYSYLDGKIMNKVTPESLLNNGYSADSIITVSFQDTLPAVLTDAWDVSDRQDGSVIAWTEPADEDGMFNLYIAAEGGIYANPDSSSLFSGFENLKFINFNHCFYTNIVTNASSMFAGCQSLLLLDLNGLDTSNITDMSHMFEGCSSMKALSLAFWNIGHVTDMSYMFAGCQSLEYVNVAGLDTSNVTDMERMFSGCKSLEILNISGWNFANALNLNSMFSDTGIHFLFANGCTYPAYDENNFKDFAVFGFLSDYPDIKFDLELCRPVDAAIALGFDPVEDFGCSYDSGEAWPIDVISDYIHDYPDETIDLDTLYPPDDLY